MQTDFFIIFAVHQRVVGVVNQRPDDAGGEEPRACCGNGAEDGSLCHEDGAGKSDAEHQLRGEEEALAEWVEECHRAAGDGEQHRLPVEQQHQQEVEEEQKDAERECLASSCFTAGQRAMAGALDVAVEVTVGKVVEDAAGAAHQPCSEQDDGYHAHRWLTVAREP